MEFYFADRGIRLMVADTWTAKPLRAMSAIACPIGISERAVQELQTYVFVEMYSAVEPVEALAKKLMWPRTHDNDLLGKKVDIHGVNGLEFAYTDGILDIESMFLAVQPGRVLEIMFSAEPEYKDGFKHNHEDLRGELGKFVDVGVLVGEASRWTPSV